MLGMSVILSFTATVVEEDYSVGVLRRLKLNKCLVTSSFRQIRCQFQIELTNFSVDGESFTLQLFKDKNDSTVAHGYARESTQNQAVS